MKVPRLLAITDRGRLPLPAVPGWAEDLVEMGVDALRLREPGLDDAILWSLLTEVGRLDRRPALFVSGRADLAVAGGADGLHLPSDGVPVRRARTLCGAEMPIGRSVHSVGEVAAALDEGADFALLGPVWNTPGKTGVGLGALERAATLGLPVLALGGVTIARLPELASAGAAGAAGIRCFLPTAPPAPWGEAARRAFGEP